jgi:hypothetical protein
MVRVSMGKEYSAQSGKSRFSHVVDDRVQRGVRAPETKKELCCPMIIMGDASI